MYQSVPLCTLQIRISCDLSLLHGVGGQCSKKNLLHCAPSLSPKVELWTLEAAYGPLVGMALHIMLCFWCGQITGPKKSWFPGPNLLPLTLVMDMPHQKYYVGGRINHRSINSYYTVVLTKLSVIFLGFLIQKVCVLAHGSDWSLFRIMNIRDWHLTYSVYDTRHI